MDVPATKKYRPHLIVFLIVLFMAVAFVLRIIPAIVTRDQAFFPVYDTDTWYNLRQIEVMVHHFPQYNWFDPMTAYPVGKLIDWGPLYPFLAAVLCLITNASTRDAIVWTAGFLSPILAVLMVPVMYELGKKLGDSKTGLVAAGLISISSILYFSYTSYGMVDHHGAEVFFSSLFFLGYLYAIHYAQKNPVDIRNRSTLPYFCLISSITGMVYFLGLITSTTTVLTLLVIAAYTLVQGLFDFYDRKSSHYLCILNLVLLGVATILLFVFGFKREGISFSQYSLGIVYIHLGLVAETIIIGVLAEIFRNNRTGFFAGIAGIAAGGLVLSQAVPSLQSISGQALNLLFGFSVYTVGVQETLPWSWANATDTFNVGIILAAGGFLVLGYSLWKQRTRELVFFTVWSALMLLITIQHQRFLYYFTVNIVLLIALCITEPLRWENNPVHRYLSSVVSGNDEDKAVAMPQEKNVPPVKTGKKKKQGSAPARTNTAGSYLAGICFIAICILALAHCALSLQQDYLFGVTAGERQISSDWLESLRWLEENTPDPGIDYFGQYDSRLYSAPPDSYGIMSVWDAGHWITFFAHRMPVTNPFQDNLGSTRGTAAFFLSDNESEATGILDSYRARYIITDSGMAVDRFTNLVPWMTGSVDVSHYIKWFLIPETGNNLHLQKTHRFDDGYFQSMAVRLQMFDGSMTEPSTAEYTRYDIRLPTAQESADATGYSRVITNEKTVTVSGLDNSTPLVPEGPELLPITYAALYSSQPDKPLQKVPALRHYRLLYESDHDSTVIPFPESAPIALPGVKAVKVFEYVRGARIAGTGIIELPLVTNTGRAFTYRQESIAGEFIVPYSSTGNTSGVHATGAYHLAGTDRYLAVSEEDVTNGKTVTFSS